MARSFSQKLFGRPVSGEACSPQFVPDLEKLAADLEPDRRAAGVNIEIDWRVCTERLERLCAWMTNSDPDEERPPNIKAALHEFYAKEIRGVKEPDFLKDHNKVNRRDKVAGNEVLVNAFRFPENTQMMEEAAAVEGLGGLLSTSGAREVLRDIFPPGAPKIREDDRTPLLDDRQARFLSNCLPAITKPSYHPVWAGLWEEMKPFVQFGPDFWLSALGVRSSASRLCFLYRYQLDALDGTRLFLPTFLDSDLCPEHFPNPSPDCSWQRGPFTVPAGGHPVSLHTDTDGPTLLQEFIHEDFRREPEMVVAWGWTGGMEPLKALELARRDHYSRLNRDYAGIEDWVREPI